MSVSMLHTLLFFDFAIIYVYKKIIQIYKNAQLYKC